MMQEYGKLLKNSFKNPFDDFNASLINTDKIVEFWCDPVVKNQKELLSLPAFFEHKMPFIIQGSRGSGKTMIFKYYSYEAQKVVAKSKGKILDHLSDCGGVGFYFRCDPPFINSLKSVCINSSLEEWDELFSYYMQMTLSSNILDMIFDLENEKEIDASLINCSLVEHVSDQFGTSEIVDIHDLYRTISGEIKKIQDFKNLSIFMELNNPLIKKFTPHSLSDELISFLKENINPFNKMNFILMVDEYESLPDELQRSFNTMLKYANDKISIRLGRRTEKNITTATINETEYLRINNDYLLIDLDEKIGISDSKKYFYEVAQKRLNLVFENNQIDAKKLFGDSEDLLKECIDIAENKTDHIIKILKADAHISDNQIDQIATIISYPDNPIMEMLNALWVIRDKSKNKIEAAQYTKNSMLEYIEKKPTRGAKKYYLDYENKYRYSLTVLLCSIYKKNKLYYSFNTISHLSNGNTRVFINLCREIISDALFYETENFFEKLSVSPSVQSRAIHKFSAKEFDDICSIIRYGENVRKLVLNLGNMFSEFHKDRRVRYPETNQFVLDQLELDFQSSETLNMALRWSLIIKKSVPQRLSMDINKRGDIFYVNRVFSPLFNISYRTRGGFNVSILKDELPNMCYDIYTPKAIEKVRAEKGEKKKDILNDGAQLTLFSEWEDNDDA